MVEGMVAKKSKQGAKSLEIAMIDVLDGLEDAATYMAYQSTPNTLIILSIEPAVTSKPGIGEPNYRLETQIKPGNYKTSLNILNFLTKRDLKRSA